MPLGDLQGVLFAISHGERVATDIAALEARAIELFDLAIELGGSLSGEHGLGLVKSVPRPAFVSARVRGASAVVETASVREGGP
jgi:FAD linked oxidases, C-terminal domain.